VNRPSNWSQLTRSKGKTRAARGEEIRRCVIANNAANHVIAPWDPARHPYALIGNPPPLQTFVERRSALLQRALPLSRARS
jgi:hypothetical protein